MAKDNSSNGPASADEDGGKQKRRDAKLAEYLRRMDHVVENYRFSKKHFGDSRRFNQSLRDLRKATNPKARKRDKRVRLAPELEAAIAIGVETRRTDAVSDTYVAPSADLVGEVCENLSRALTPVRGRPDDAVLRYHVQAMMVLFEWATGNAVTASPTTNSEYLPQMTSAGARVIQFVFADLEPSLPVTTLMNIIRTTRAKRELEGKRFGDFFPFYGGSIDPETGFPIPGPGFKLEKFGLTHPIYCS